jgi:hypothetical protein
MRKKTLFLAFAFSFLAVPLQAEPAPPKPPTLQEMQQMQMLNPGPSLFAFAGKACPGGSEPYKGPEQALAAESGAVYCVISKQVTIFSKKTMEKCPDGFKSHADAKAKPDADVIWCESDPSYKPNPPAAPATSSAQIIGGEVAHVEGDAIVLRGTGGVAPRKLKLGGGIEVVEQQPKDSKKFQAEQEAFEKKTEKSGFLPGLTPPVPFEEKKISVSDLKENDRVIVTFEIKDGSEMVKKISRQPAPASLPPPPPPKSEAPPSTAPKPAAAPAPVTTPVTPGPKPEAADTNVPVKAEPKPPTAPPVSDSKESAPAEPAKKK